MYPWGQYPISRELPLPGPWFRYVTPTCLVQATGDQCSTAMAVPAPSLPLALPLADATKPALRQAALARRKVAANTAAGSAVAFHFLGGIELPAGATVAGVYYWLKTLILGVDVPGFASLIVATLLLGGLILAKLGLVGLYIGRIYEEVKGRPLYVVRRTETDVEAPQAQLPLSIVTDKPAEAAE